MTKSQIRKSYISAAGWDSKQKRKAAIRCLHCLGGRCTSGEGSNQWVCDDCGKLWEPVWIPDGIVIVREEHCL